MADGRYRVTRGGDGARYLYLFPPTPGAHASLVLDTGESDEFEVVVGLPDDTQDWSVSAFEALLDVLEARASERRGGST